MFPLPTGSLVGTVLALPLRVNPCCFPTGSGAPPMRGLISCRITHKMLIDRIRVRVTQSAAVHLGIPLFLYSRGCLGMSPKSRSSPTMGVARPSDATLLPNHDDFPHFLSSQRTTRCQSVLLYRSCPGQKEGVSLAATDIPPRLFFPAWDEKERKVAASPLRVSFW